MKTLIVGLLVFLVTAASSTVAQDYNHDVSGYDEEGAYVSGNVDAYRDDKSVDGYIYTEDGETKYFDGEWVGEGEIEGYDEDGNYLYLEVE